MAQAFTTLPQHCTINMNTAMSGSIRLSPEENRRPHALCQFAEVYKLTWVFVHTEFNFRSAWLDDAIIHLASEGGGDYQVPFTFWEKY